VKDRADFEALKTAAKPKRHARGSLGKQAAE
jgi:anthraniloyl-CoA monooxygenase